MREMKKKRKIKQFFKERERMEKAMGICRCRRKSRDWMIQETNLATTFSLSQLSFSPSLSFYPYF